MTTPQDIQTAANALVAANTAAEANFVSLTALIATIDADIAPEAAARIAALDAYQIAFAAASVNHGLAAAEATYTALAGAAGAADENLRAVTAAWLNGQ